MSVLPRASSLTPTSSRSFHTWGRRIRNSEVPAQVRGRGRPAHVRFSNRPFWVKHFQAIHHRVLMSLAGSRFSSESALRPFHHGVRRRGGTISWAALPSDERRVQADMRTHLIHRPARDIIPPRGGARVSSYRI